MIWVETGCGVYDGDETWTLLPGNDTDIPEHSRSGRLGVPFVDPSRRGREIWRALSRTSKVSGIWLSNLAEEWRNYASLKLVSPARPCDSWFWRAPVAHPPQLQRHGKEDDRPQYHHQIAVRRLSEAEGQMRLWSAMRPLPELQSGLHIRLRS